MFPLRLRSLRGVLGSPPRRPVEDEVYWEGGRMSESPTLPPRPLPPVPLVPVLPLLVLYPKVLLLSIDVVDGGRGRVDPEPTLPPVVPLYPVAVSTEAVAADTDARVAATEGGELR